METNQPNQTPPNVSENLAKPQLKRQAGSFALYMKENYSQFKHLPNKERLKSIAEKYKSEKPK